MKVQVYAYFHNPAGSICNVAKEWCLELEKHFDVKVHDYSGQNCRFPKMIHLLGEHDPVADVGIYFGYPSYIKTSGNLLAKHKVKIAVFTSETTLSDLEVGQTKLMDLDLLCVPSNYVRCLFNNVVHRNRIMVVNHGVNEKFFECKSAKRNDFTYLYVFQNSQTGGTVERKGFIELLQAFKLLRESHKLTDVKMLIKTTSNIEADIEKLKDANENVEFNIRYLPIEELANLYSSCHAYVNSSRAEGFGITVLEAMAAGIPVVSPIHTGLTEMLSEMNCVSIKYDVRHTTHFRYATNNGEIVKIDPVEIAKSMKYTYDHYQELSKYSEQLRDLVIQKYSWENVLKGAVQWIKEHNM